MNKNKLIKTLLLRLRLPEQTLGKLSFSKSASVRHMKNWIDTLPLTRTSFVANILCSALPELTQLQTDPKTRLQLIEAIRPAIQDCISGLSKDFLHQPLALSETATQAASAAQILQKHLGNAYLITVRDLILSGKNLDLLPTAIHRALNSLSLFIWRGYLLYIPIAPQMWLETHTLYLLAEALDIQSIKVIDANPHHGHVKTIEQAYLRISLLSAAQPNHLRQQELIDVYYALEVLAPFAKLEPFGRQYKNNLYAMMLYSFSAPIYQSRIPASYDDAKRTINTDQLIPRLNDKNFTNSNSNKNTNSLSPSLTTALALSWHKTASRKNERHKSKGNIDVLVGLTSIHFYCSGNIEFKEFLQQNNKTQSGMIELDSTPEEIIEERPKKHTFDPNNVDFGPGVPITSGAYRAHHNANITDAQQKQYPRYTINIADYSNDGYYLRWVDNTPQQLGAGQILGLKKAGESQWSIGVVAWVRHTKGTSHTGIHILSTHAIPVAAIPQNSTKRDYLRALQLPNSLITNAVGFQEYDSIELYRSRADFSIQLAKRLLGTGIVSQFAYRELGQNQETTEKSNIQE